MGQRPDVRFVDHSGQGRGAPDLTTFAWLSQRAGTRVIAWWHLRRDSDGHRAQAGREAYQGRGPPGRRAADALS
jgi:type II secretory pathway component PulL